ncbi:MAG: hypothetical protein KAS01_02295 [Candidatus Pacebacteria bacterium]|nr:hypothetical protein [Candidatus Paceibacterota bacterium]
MELKEYFEIIKRKFKLIIAVAFVVTSSTFLFSALQPTRYETSLSLFLSKDKSQQTDDFKYDGYYALEASEKIADSITQWAKSPELVNAVYQKAEVDDGFQSLKSYTKKFNAKKMSPQYVEVKFETNNAEEADKISKAIVEEINDKVIKLEKDSEGEISFLVSNENPIIIQKQKNIFLNSMIGFISGIAFGIFFVFFRRYFSK